MDILCRKELSAGWLEDYSCEERVKRKDDEEMKLMRKMRGKEMDENKSSRASCDQAKGRNTREELINEK